MENAVIDQEKASLYRTARFTDQTLSGREITGEPLPVGPVRVVYYGTIHKAMCQEQEAVFSVFATPQSDSFIGHFFAYALTDFVL